MADFILTNIHVPADVVIEADRNQGMHESPIGRNPQFADFDGDRWRFKLSFSNEEPEDEKRLSALLSRISAVDSYMMMYHVDKKLPSGGLKTEVEDLLGDKYLDFTSGEQNDWTAIDGATLSVNNNRIKIKNGSAPTVAGGARKVVTVTSGENYIARVFGVEGSASELNLEVRDDADDTLIAEDTATESGKLQVPFAAPASGSVRLVLRVDNLNGGEFVFYEFIQVFKTPLVKGASQTGKGLVIDNLPASQEGLALAGEYFEVAGEMKRLTEDVDSDANGEAFIQFEFAIRHSALPDNEPVIFNRAMSQTKIPSASFNVGLGKAARGTFNFELVEKV